MRTGLLLVVSLVLVGCMPTMIGRAELDEHYEQTSQAEGVLSAVPIRLDADDPPTVVNWWYAGTRNGEHYLVYRELTWNDQGEPVGKERRYRVPATQLTVRASFDKTRNDAKWLPLYEAALGVPPPIDLPTARSRPGLVRPDPIEPKNINPDQPTPRPDIPQDD